MNSSIICDYVSLFIYDAKENGLSDLANGMAVWDIPEKAFYFKDRGSVCLMSVASATLPSEYGGSVIMMTQQGYNGFTTQENSPAADLINQDLSVLGSFTNFSTSAGGHFSHEYQQHETIKLLTSTKPRQIKLFFFKDDKTPYDMTLETETEREGHITLKFEYIDPEKLRENNYGVEYKAAF